MSDININFAISEPINANLTVQELGNVALTIDSNIAANFGIDGVTYNITNNYSNSATGPAGAIQYSDGSGNFLGSNNLSWNSSESVLTIVNAESGNAQTAELQLVDYYSSNAQFDTDQDIIAAHARGNRTNPANVETGDDILRMSGWGYTGVGNTVIDGRSGWAQGGGIIWQAQGNTFTANYSIPSLCVLYVGNGNGNSVAQGPNDFGGYYNYTFTNTGTLSLARLLASNSVIATNSMSTNTMVATTANVTNINSSTVITSQANTGSLNVSNSSVFGGNISFNNSVTGPNGYIKWGKVDALHFVDYTANSGFDYDIQFWSARGNQANPQPVQVGDTLFVVPGFAYTGNGAQVGVDSPNTGWVLTSHHIEVQVAEQPTVPGGCPSTKVRLNVSNATANNQFYKNIELDQTGLVTMASLRVNEIAQIPQLTKITYQTDFTQQITISGPGTFTFWVTQGARKLITNNATGNLNLNIIGSQALTFSSLLGEWESMTVALMMTTGATAATVGTISIDGVAQTVKYVNGVAPTTNTNSVTEYSYEIIKTSATPTYTVLGSFTRYS
jgi:hypothetical protein